MAPWTPPFAAFLAAANDAFSKIPREDDTILGDKTLLEKFVKLSEERSFVSDIVDRVKQIAAAFDRLRELWLLYRDLDQRRWKLIDGQRVADARRVQFMVPDQLQEDLRRYEIEAQVLVAFLYHETTALVNNLLKGTLKPEPGSDLEYLVKVRDKFLVHPRGGARTKNSSSALTVGPILHAHLIGGESHFPAIRAYYRGVLAATGVHDSDEVGSKRNVDLIRGKKLAKDFLDEDKLRLKAYNIPEPDLLGSALELARLLDSEFLPRLGHACSHKASSWSEYQPATLAPPPTSDLS